MTHTSRTRAVGSGGGAGGGSMTKGTTATATAATGSGTAAALRDLLSSVVQQVESHLPLYPSSSSTPPTPTPSPSSPSHRQVGRRRRRIRNWIIYGKDEDGRLTGGSGGDNSLHFADASEEDDFGEDAIGGGADDAGLFLTENGSYVAKKKKKSYPTAIADSLNQTSNRTSSANHTRASERKTRMHMLPEEIREEETVDTLTGLMGDGFDREVARRILRKYDGNVDKAAGALLEGERGEELVGPAGVGAGSTSGHGQGWPASGGAGTGSGWSTGTGAGSGQGQGQIQRTPSQARLDVVPSALSGRPNTPIDPTLGEDDPDLQRAMQESMSTLHNSHSGSRSQLQTYTPSSQGQSHSNASQIQVQVQVQSEVAEGPVFGPSERPADPSWAIVPSHQNESNDANFLQNLNRAIEASLETMGDSDALEPFPVEQQLRRDGCPVVLRPSMHTMVYATSVLQGLFYVPQVRQRMSCWRPPVPTDDDEAAPPMSGPDFTLWALSEIFTHMDLARLCDLNVDKRLSAFNIEPWERPGQPPGELSRRFFARLSATLEKAFTEQFARSGQPPPKPRLLHFQYGNGVSEPGEVLQETSIVPIDVNGGDSHDLIGQLSAQLSKPQSEPGKQSVIFESSEVVAFELARSSSTSGAAASAGGSDKKGFTYPKSIYLDQFLKENLNLAQGKRRERQEMSNEVQRLVSHKQTLTHFGDKDTLKDLQSTIFYFENVADAEDDPERGASIQATTKKLKGILRAVEEGIKAADERINALRVQAETLFDCEELQQCRYDLRVVFVHDGLYGRKHLYSYVHDKSCWWKIADSLIKKVPEEEVLSDQAGLHLGAGPYLLLYSRAIPESDDPGSVLPWMDDIKDDVKAANREFLSQLPPELVGDIAIDEEFLCSLPSDLIVGKEDGMDTG